MINPNIWIRLATFAIKYGERLAREVRGGLSMAHSERKENQQRELTTIHWIEPTQKLKTESFVFHVKIENMTSAPGFHFDVSPAITMIRDLDGRFIGLVEGQIFESASHRECFLFDQGQVINNDGAAKQFKMFTKTEGATIAGFPGSWAFIVVDQMAQQILFACGDQYPKGLSYHWNEESFVITSNIDLDVTSSVAIPVPSGRFYCFDLSQSQLKSFPAR